MKTAKITCTFEIEIELDPENYDNETTTPDQMIEVDIQNFKDDPELILNHEWDKYTVTGTIL